MFFRYMNFEELYKKGKSAYLEDNFKVRKMENQPLLLFFSEITYPPDVRSSLELSYFSNEVFL